MNKIEVQKRVLKDGKPLNLGLFTWRKKTRTFSSLENNLVIDFSGINNCTFDTGCNCTFKTVSNCTFNTAWDCTFKTGSYCTFYTGCNCTFDTGGECIVVRRDVFEVIKLEEKKPIKLNSDDVPGFVYLNDPTEKVSIELTQEQLDKIKQQGII